MRHNHDLKMTPAFLVAALAGDQHNALAAATPGGIEAQEAAGQTMFVCSSTLPKDMGRNTREQFEKIGIRFGPDADDLFVNVTLPTGWKKVATGHSMWSDLVDDKGRKRAAIFYKAAFYDRSAHLRLTRRYSIDKYFACDSGGMSADSGVMTHFAVDVTDGSIAIHRIGIYGERDYKHADELEAQAWAWLKERFPQHEDPAAYWD